MRGRSRRLLLVWGGLAISGVFAWLAVRGLDLDEAGRAVRSLDGWWLVPAVVALAAANAVRVWRWQVLFSRETRPRFGPAAAALLIGTFFNNVLPARAGEAAQVLWLRRAGASAAETAGTVLLGRVYDVLGALVLLFCLVPWLPSVTWLRAAGILAVALVAGLAVAAVVLVRGGEPAVRAVLSPLARLPRVDRARLAVAAGSLERGLVGLRRPGLVTGSLVLTVAGWAVFGVSNWCVLEAFHLGLSPLAGILVTIAATVALAIPSSPASVGVFEAATLVALDPYDVPHAQALSYAVVLHLVNLVPYLVAGGAILLAAPRAARVPR